MKFKFLILIIFFFCFFSILSINTDAEYVLSEESMLSDMNTIVDEINDNSSMSNEYNKIITEISNTSSRDEDKNVLITQIRALRDDYNWVKTSINTSEKIVANALIYASINDVCNERAFIIC